MSDSFVYFVKPVDATGPIKIGVSGRPKERLSKLLDWSPVALEVVWTIPGNHQLERNIHECFADLHSHKEWFHAAPRLLEAIERLNRYLRNDSVIGRRLFELCAIIGAWEIRQQYEWSGHEPAALQFGVSQKAIDTIKFNRPIEGLPEDEAVVIQMGRQIFREHRLDSELYARAVKLFGRQGTLELSITMGDYVLAGIMLITADHQLPPNRPALLPAR